MGQSREKALSDFEQWMKDCGADWFSIGLIQLLMKADSTNRLLLGEVYPEYVTLMEEYRGLRPKSEEMVKLLEKYG